MRCSLHVLAVGLAASVRALCAMAEDASVSFPAICTEPRDVVVCGGGPAGCAATMLDCIMAEEGVDVLFETRAVGVEKAGEKITHVITHSKDGFRRIPAKVVIDATGDADVANFAGCPVFVGRDGDHLTTPATGDSSKDR